MNHSSASRVSIVDIKKNIMQLYRKHAVPYEAQHKQSFCEAPGYDLHLFNNIMPQEVEPYIKHIAPSLLPNEILIASYGTHPLPILGMGSGVFITRTKIYWKNMMFPGKRCMALSHVHRFSFEDYEPSGRYDAVVSEEREMHIHYQDLEGEMRSAAIQGFPEQTADFLNEVLSYLKSLR